MARMAIVRYAKKKRRSRCDMALTTGFIKQWIVYDEYVKEKNPMVKTLERLKFKFIDTSRSRAMGVEHTLYLFESMQEDGIRFNIFVKDEEIAKLENKDGFKALLREKCLRVYGEEMNRLEEQRRKEEFVLKMGDVI